MIVWGPASIAPSESGTHSNLLARLGNVSLKNAMPQEDLTTVAERSVGGPTLFKPIAKTPS
jgi:hypothetical protein